MPALFTPNIQLKRLHKDAQVPAYQSVGAAGFDLHARVDSPVIIPAGVTRKIGIGVAVSIGDPSIALYIMARSGLAARGIALANGVGLVDSDYQGELIVALHNYSDVDFIVHQGERIAQGVFAPVLQVAFTEVEDFSEKTERGAGGFGSTGGSSEQDALKAKFVPQASTKKAGKA